ncbi:MAG: hypothetical protein ACM3U2_17160 [Deltaproteobacteria bacterium]
MLPGWRSLVILVGVSLAGRLPAPGRAALADDTPARPATPPAAGEPVPAAESPVPEKYTLAYKFLPNQVWHYEVFNESEITTSVKDETETVRNSSRSKRHYTVKAVDEKTGEGDLELFIDWVHMVASFDNPSRPKTEPVEFQSDDPEKHPSQFEDVLATVGKPRATIRFSPSGKPVKVLEGALPPPPTAARQVSQGPAAPPVTDASSETYFLPLPEEPVAVGAAWKDRVDVLCRDYDKNLVKITIQRNYKLAEVKGKRATIELRTAVLTPVQDPAVAGQLIQRQISGSLVFDLERGVVISRESGVDNTVVGPFGPRSSMRAKSKYREKLVEEEATARRDDEPGAATK